MAKPKIDKVDIDPLRVIKVQDGYFKWKDLNSTLSSYATRGINFPDAISEPLGCYALDLWWNKGTAGDAISKIDESHVEMKATSNFDRDLTSFGPRTTFDNLVFLRLDYDNDKLYIYDLNVDSEEIKEWKVNSNETLITNYLYKEVNWVEEDEQGSFDEQTGYYKGFGMI